MILRHATFVLTLVVGMLAVRSAAGADIDDKDKVFRRNGSPMLVFVESETANDVTYRTIKAQATPSHLRIGDLDHIIYNGMDGGHWAKGVEERETGHYETAAEHFNQLATAGSREWEKVYGSFAEGECWELAGRFAEAAKAFGAVVSGFGGAPAATPPVPPHRLWMDAKYRMGMNLALAKSTADATKVADEFEAMGKKDSVLGAESRANAIRAAIAGTDANLGKFTEYMKKVTFRAAEEREVWFHFKLFCAESLRLSFKKNKEAASVYREILSGLGNDPTRQAQASLGLGLCLIDSDRQGAIIELLKLDLLPYGSADQKCEARFNVGRLLWDEAQAIRANPEAMKDERKANFVKDTERAARLIVAAATEGPAKNPNVALARSLLEGFGPDADAPKPTAPQAAPKSAPEAPKK